MPVACKELNFGKLSGNFFRNIVEAIRHFTKKTAENGAAVHISEVTDHFFDSYRIDAGGAGDCVQVVSGSM